MLGILCYTFPCRIYEQMWYFYGGPKGSNTNQFPKTQIRFRKHKPISKSTNQFRETLTNFQKHKPKSQNTNQNSRERPGKESIVRAIIHEVLRTQENAIFCYHCGWNQEEEFIYCPYHGVKDIRANCLCASLLCNYNACHFLHTWIVFYDKVSLTVANTLKCNFFFSWSTQNHEKHKHIEHIMGYIMLRHQKLVVVLMCYEI